MTIPGAKCLVLGGGGFIGTNLCFGLLKAGADVEGFGRTPPPANLLAALRWRRGELDNIEYIRQAVRGKEYVFHLLGSSVPAESNNDPAGDIVSSLLPSLRLMDICRDEGVRRIIFASSGGTVYGITSGKPIPETTPTNPITAYGVNKLAIEKYLHLYRHHYGLDSISLRISNPYGPFQYGRRPQGVIGSMIARVIAGQHIEIWGDGSVIRDFIHVEDVVDAMINSVSYRESERVFNVGSGQGRSLLSVAESVCEILGVGTEQIRYLPGRQADVPINVLDISLIQRAFAWRPRIDWVEGLTATVRWAQSTVGHALISRTGIRSGSPR